MRFPKRALVGLIAPKKGSERSFLFDQFLHPPGIIDNRLNLAAMADNAFIREQLVDIRLGEVGNPIEIEIMEGGAEVFALGENSRVC